MGIARREARNTREDRKSLIELQFVLAADPRIGHLEQQCEADGEERRRDEGRHQGQSRTRP